jgi:PAS domain S-box-containing protein
MSKAGDGAQKAYGREHEAETLRAPGSTVAIEAPVEHFDPATQTPQAEDELRAIIDNAPVFLWSDLPDGYCDFLNRPWLSYFNLSLQEAQGTGWATLLHPDDAAHHLETWQKSVSTGTPFETEARFRSPDGEYRWFLTRANPLRDKTGRIVKWYGTNIDIENLKRTERRLRQSEANLAEAQRLSHTGSWALSPATTKILYWSEECYRIWGFDPVQGLPNRETVWRRIHPGDRDRMYEETQEALRRKRDYKVDFRIVLPDGTVKYLEAIGHHLFSEHGELVQVVGTNVDVTERKRAEEALRESEYKLRQIIETVPSHLWTADPDGEPTHLNQRHLDYFGIRRLEDVKHGGWQAFLHPDDLAESAKALSHAVQTETSYRAVHRLRRADGEFRWHDARAEPLRDRQGRIIQWYGLSVDIDEAKKAEDRLRRSEAYLAEAQRLSHTGTWAFNETTTLYWSEESYRIWGFDPLQGVPSREAMWQRVHPDDRDWVRQGARDARRQKRDYAVEHRIVLPDGTIRYLEATAHFVSSADGELFEVVGTHVDVTERKRAQEERERLRQLEADLAHMNRLGIMGELAASLAHEITQPIASARNNARAALNFLDQQPSDLGEVRGALGCIVGDADRAGNIIDRIREHIKKAPPRRERFDLNGAINEVIVLAQSAITENAVSVQTRLADGLFPMQGDCVQMQQVILNLILNAVEAMSSVEAGARELMISTEQTKTGGALVAVRDSGPGIDPEHLERVFQAFYTTKASGTGMGLSICRSIIEAHGGRLRADVNKPRGAVFQFTLPGEEAVRSS